MVNTMFYQTLKSSVQGDNEEDLPVGHDIFFVWWIFMRVSNSYDASSKEQTNSVGCMAEERGMLNSRVLQNKIP